MDHKTFFASCCTGAGGQRNLATAGAPAWGQDAWWKLMNVCDTLLITTIPEKSDVIWCHRGIQDDASAAAQREREHLDKLTFYKDQLEVGSEAVILLSPPRILAYFLPGWRASPIFLRCTKSCKDLVSDQPIEIESSVDALMIFDDIGVQVFFVGNEKWMPYLLIKIMYVLQNMIICIYIYIYFKMHRLLCIICKHPVVEKRLKNIGDYKTSHQFRMLSFTERFAGSPGGSISSWKKQDADASDGWWSLVAWKHCCCHYDPLCFGAIKFYSFLGRCGSRSAEY